MFQLLLRKQTTAPSCDLQSDEEARLAEVIESVMRGGGTSEIPRGRFGDALTKLIRSIESRVTDDIELVSALSAETSETAITVGWVLHDIHEMTSSSQSICSALEDLASSTNAMAENSVASAEGADSVRLTLENCAVDSYAATNAMTVIDNRVSYIVQRLSVLESTSAQIRTMAGKIEAIAAQTNLLALNATIEAARAGVAGRGFSIVAGEVKELSKQTATLTDEISKTLGTFAHEMGEIKSAVADSHEAVSHGSEIVNHVSEHVSATGEAIRTVAGHARYLAGLIEQQRSTTKDIAKSTSKIAATLCKSETEIEAINARLVSCEKMALNSFSEAEHNHPSEDIARILVDAAIFKRRLAAVLTGQMKPEEINAFDTGLMRSHLKLCQKKGRVDPGIGAIIEHAHTVLEDQAECVIAAVRTQKWEAATRAYRACEKALADLSNAAHLLLAGLKGDGGASAEYATTPLRGMAGPIRQ